MKFVAATVLAAMLGLPPSSLVDAWSLGCLRPITYWTHPSSTHSTFSEKFSVGCPNGRGLEKPWDAKMINSHYLLFDKDNSVTPIHIFRWNHSFAEENPEVDRHFAGKPKISFITHGYTENGAEQWISQLVQALLDRKDGHNMKVLVGDWNEGAAGAGTMMDSRYRQAASNVEMYARMTGEFLMRIFKRFHISEENVHLMGHSLGGQTVGEVSRWLNSQHSFKVARVTAFDPAAILFGVMGGDVLLNKENAHFMTVLHTSACTSTLLAARGAVGVLEPIGHVDIYPNNGSIIQPACKENNTFFCSHQRGYKFFTQMVAGCGKHSGQNKGRSCDLTGKLCSSESQASQGQCSQGEVQVWRHLQTRARENLEYAKDGSSGKNKSRKTDPQNQKDIIWFETDGDQLRIECTP